MEREEIKEIIQNQIKRNQNIQRTEIRVHIQYSNIRIRLRKAGSKLQIPCHEIRNCRHNRIN